MSSFRDKVDRFLFKFSYSFKIKSVIFGAASVAIFIAIMLVNNQSGMLSSVHKQKFGIHFQQELNSLLLRVLKYKVAIENDSLELDKSQLKGEIVASIESILALSDEAQIAVLSNQSPATKELIFTITQLTNSWNDLQDQTTKVDPEIRFLDLINTIRNLSSTSNTIFLLCVNMDTGMHFLLDALTEQMAQIAIWNTLLSTAPKLSSDEIPLKVKALIVNQRESLINNYHMLQRDLEKAYQENTIIQEMMKDQDTREILGKFLLVQDQLMSLIQSDNRSSSMVEIALSSLNLIDSLDFILMYQSSNLLEVQASTLRLRQNYGVGFIIFGIFVVLAAYTTRLIRRPVAGIRNAAEELAQGNMGVRIRVQAEDEVGQICISFNFLVEQIEKIIHDANSFSNKLAALSKEIFSTAKQFEDSVVRQELAITHIASNAKGVSRTVQDFAKSLQEVSQSATITANLANIGRKSLNEMEQIMLQMAKASMSIVKTLSDLEEKIGTINAVISTIVKIADQINLLSLNTAIRAGKPGMQHLGFSVVADKISELADQTALATLDIEELVKSIITRVTESVLVVDRFSDQIRNQVYEATATGEQLKKLIDNTQRQFEAFENINVGMQNQSLRAQQIHESINLLTAVAQNTTQSVRNLHLEIEYLHHSTHNLQTTTKKIAEESFKELIQSG